MSEESRTPLLRLEGIIKEYDGEVVTRVLHGIDMVVERGEFVALQGRSGSGKSTLLNILGLLDRATAGDMWLDGQRISELDDDELTTLRGRSLGFIFQFHHLISALSAVENVMMPLIAQTGRVQGGMRERAIELLDEVGLADRADESPRRLSGGQQQRVAIARALVSDPPLILADEPTGNLDSATADEVFALLKKTTRDKDVAVLMVTHDGELARRCDRIVNLVDGLVADVDEPNPP